MQRISGLLALALLLESGIANGQTAYPMLMSLRPAAVQVGQMAEVTLSSRYSMYGAYDVLVSGEGVTAEVLHPPLKVEDLAKPPNL
jgi:hypothetical protein